MDLGKPIDFINGSAIFMKYLN